MKSSDEEEKVVYFHIKLKTQTLLESVIDEHRLHLHKARTECYVTTEGVEIVRKQMDILFQRIPEHNNALRKYSRHPLKNKDIIITKHSHDNNSKHTRNKRPHLISFPVSLPATYLFY